LGRGEKSRAEQPSSEEQKIAEDADGVFAPWVVIAMKVEYLAAVEGEGDAGDVFVFAFHARAGIVVVAVEDAQLEGRVRNKAEALGLVQALLKS